MTPARRATLCLLIGALVGFPASAQKVVNMSLLSQLDVVALGADTSCNVGPTVVPVNEVWGWDGPASEALALVGLCNGTAIIDVSTPAAPALLHTVPGPLSVWRDVKTFDHYAYIVHDVLDSDDPAGVGVGVQIVDLADSTFPVVNTLTDGFTRAHNLYVDEARAHLYVIGWDPDPSTLAPIGFHPEGEAGFSHGFRIYDLSADPEQPEFLGMWDEHYVHDLHVRGNTVYAAALNEGLWFVDVANPAAPSNLDHVTYTQTLGGGTIDQFTHNAWADEAGAVAVVTDEEVGQRVKFFDVSPVTSATKISEYEAKPGILAHNAFLLGGRAYISYYSEGAVILDISDPTQPCEIGYHDTYLGASAQDGAWGIYPFTASGLIYVSDISGGFFVLDFEPPAHDPVDIALVLDVSGSMASTAPGGAAPKIDVLKDSVELFVETWRRFTVPEDRLGIVYFESAVDTAFINGTLTTPFCPNHAEFVADVRARPTGNLTALGGGLLTAVRSFAPSAGPQAVILVTDGMQNVSPMVVEAGIETVFFDLHDTLVEGPVPDGPWTLLPGAAELVADLKAAGIRVGVITNTFPGWTRADLDARMADPAFLDEFEVLVLSSVAGVSKPNPAIYTQALGLLGSPVPATHAAFVTETLAHIADVAASPTEGARAVGMVGIHLDPGPGDPQADHTVADLAPILGIVQASADPPRHEVVTVPLGAGTYDESSVPGEPGVDLADLGPTVHTIGIGTAAGSRWQELIEDLAAETGGLHHFTDAPDADLQQFLEDDLVLALQSGSVYRVARRKGEITATNADALTFALNPTISKLGIRLSWRGMRKPGLLTAELRRLQPGGQPGPPVPPSHRVSGSFYQIDTWEFPLWDGTSAVAPAGEWQVVVRFAGDPPSTGRFPAALPYSVSVLVDDPRLRVRFEALEGAVSAGQPIPLEATVTLDGAALSRAAVRAQVSRPGAGLGTVLVEEGAGSVTPTPGSERFDAVDLRLRELMMDPAVRERLAPRDTEITLSEEDPGSYRSAFVDTGVPGSYRFDWEATGPVADEAFVRSGSFFTTVRVREFSATGIQLTATPLEGGGFRIGIVALPRDGLGNYLGPGYAHRIRAVVPGLAAPVPLDDRLDGTYAAEVVLDNPAVLADGAVLILGERVEVPPKEVERITPSRLALSLHLGVARPSGSLSAADDGLALGLDLHRRVSPRFDPGLRLNWVSFDLPLGGGDIDHLSFHPEVQIRPGTGVGRLFLEVGAGIDLVDGDSEFGAHGGVGLDFDLSGPWRGEVTYRFFKTLTGGAKPHFSQLQFGLLWKLP